MCSRLTGNTAASEKRDRRATSVPGKDQRDTPREEATALSANEVVNSTNSGPGLQNEFGRAPWHRRPAEFQIPIEGRRKCALDQLGIPPRQKKETGGQQASLAKTKEILPGRKQQRRPRRSCEWGIQQMQASPTKEAKKQNRTWTHQQPKEDKVGTKRR